jgi:hypothetical protein
MGGGQGREQIGSIMMTPKGGQHDQNAWSLRSSVFGLRPSVLRLEKHLQVLGFSV